MNNLHYKLLFILSLLPLLTHAQQPVPESLNRIMDSYQYKETRRDFYSTIQGTPYIDENFAQGKIWMNNQQIGNLLLRYNYYEGWFEFKKGDEIGVLDPISNRIDTVSLKEKTFVMVNFYMGNSLRQGYMELMNTGKTKVLIRKYISLLEAREAQGYQEQLPARFDDPHEEIYIQVGDWAALEFKGKRSLVDVFPDRHEELTEFTRQNKLKFRDMEDIILLCSYYDSL